MPTSVLVVDDDAAFRTLVVRMLARMGFTVIGEAGTVAEAASAAAGLRPDALLVDVGLPDGDGIALARTVAALPWRPRVVLTSTDRDATSCEGARAAGAVGFIPKDELAHGTLGGLLGGDGGRGGATESMSVPPPETEFEEFFDLSIDLLCVVGFDGYFKRVNPSLERTLGFEKPELFAQTVFDITHPDDVEPSRKALAQLAEGRDIVGFESRVICADGTIRWLQWNTHTMPERGVVYGVARDVSERRAADAELREAQRMLEASRDELRLLADEQAALRRVAMLVARGAPPPEVFHAVAEELGQLLDVASSGLIRYEEPDVARLVAGWGRLGEIVAVGARLALGGQNVVTEIARTGKPARMDDFAGTASGSIGQRAQRLKTETSIGGPVMVAGRLWGALIVASVDGRSLPADTGRRVAS
jgi:PAS domain S-box-containing protein